MRLRIFWILVVLFTLTAIGKNSSLNYSKAINTYYKITTGSTLSTKIVDEIQQYAYKYSIEYKVPMLYILGIMARESSFNPHASNNGTYGIMQVTEGTAKDISRWYNIPYKHLPTMELSIHWGVALLNMLYNKFHSWPNAIEHYYLGAWSTSKSMSYYKSVMVCIYKIESYE